MVVSTLRGVCRSPLARSGPAYSAARACRRWLELTLTPFRPARPVRRSAHDDERRLSTSLTGRRAGGVRGGGSTPSGCCSREGAAVLQLLAREDQALLVRRDDLLVLDLLLHVLNGVRRLHVAH